MKNNFITKIIGATLAFAMMIGGAVGINAAKEATEAYADSSAMGTYTKVTAANGISAGDTVIMVNQDGTKALQSISTTSTKYGTLYTLANGEYNSQTKTITLNGKNVEELTVEAGNSSGSFSFKGTSNIANNYLYWGSGNSLNKDATKSDNSSWTITASSGNLTIANKSTSTRLIRFNSDRFACYTSNTGTTAQLFKKQANVNVTSVSVSPTSVTLGVGATQQLTPTVLPNNATNKNVSYSSDSTSIATVSDSGLITAVAAGSTTITVTTQDGNFTATCEVTVTAPVNVTGISLNKNSTTIEVGDTETLTATVAPNDASNKIVNWSSSDDDVATVADGVVTAVTAGVATITATTVDGGFTATCEVTVTAPSSVTFASATNTTDGKSITITGITMESSNGNLSDSAGYRFYSGSTLTFTSTIGKMCSIEFTGSDGSKKISNISTTVSTGSVTVNSSANTASWTGNANTVSFTLSDQGRANQIVITMTPTAQSVTLDKDSIDLKTNELAGKQVTATVYNVDNPTFVWTPAAGNKVTVQVNSTVGNVQTVTIKPNTNTAINTSVTLTIQDTSLSATVEVHITEPEPGETAETAYTVAQAKAAITAADADIADVYIRGTISEIFEISLANHNATYWISDDGTTADQFKIYRGKYVDNADFTSDDQIIVGDEVVVFGTISKQYNNLNQGNHIVSITLAPRINSVTLTPNTITVEPGSMGDIADLFTNIVINQDDGLNKTVNDIVWTSDDQNVFCVVDDNEYLAGDTHRTSTTIHASISGREYATATVNVIDSSIHYIPYSVPAEWVLVENPSTLAAGDKVILTGVKAEVTYAAGTYSGSGNNIPADTESPLTVSGNKVTAGVVNEMIYTLETGSKAGSLAFKDSAGKYLYAAGASSNNYMKSQDSITDNASFILNANGTVVAQGTGSRSHMMYNNYAASNLFSCYESSFGNGTAITFYKLNGGNTGFVDLYSAESTTTLHGTETNEGGNLAVNNVAIDFGAKLSIAEWEAIEAIGDITDYGVKLFSTRNSITSETPVKDAIDAGKTPLTISKGSGTVPSDPEGGYYSFTATVKLTSNANYDLVFCAAPFIEVGGTVYFLDELQFSVNTLAQYYIDHSLPSELSSDALQLLA